MTTIVIEDQLSNLTCSVAYQGRWAPTMDLMISHGINYTTSNETEDSAASFSATFMPSRGDDGSVFTCETSFASPPAYLIASGGTSAINAPRFSHTCTTTITVYGK